MVPLPEMSSPGPDPSGLTRCPSFLRGVTSFAPPAALTAGLVPNCSLMCLLGLFLNLSSPLGGSCLSCWPRCPQPPGHSRPGTECVLSRLCCVSGRHMSSLGRHSRVGELRGALGAWAHASRCCGLWGQIKPLSSCNLAEMERLLAHGPGWRAPPTLALSSQNMVLCWSLDSRQRGDVSRPGRQKRCPVATLREGRRLETHEGGTIFQEL